MKQLKQEKQLAGRKKIKVTLHDTDPKACTAKYLVEIIKEVIMKKHKQGTERDDFF
ncbi:hypothetical protein R2R35_10640 [Anaerocolumna sp. AGMB13020]|uniref:hypothetical protein n=1 Tax=Anaerocolumna sp. AGMB13020 TaxID=3081750 RepID=UPI002954BA40|nr:hypothetical protein [Anaerocolumna sp. AGMB13020]WOO38913.1 hypothetical protein R2R35_10640 [Anaerocolumna sp. AGMB13020]